MEPSKDSTLHKIIFHSSACSLVGFWANKLGWCWFVVREKHYWLVDKSWLKPTSEQAEDQEIISQSFDMPGPAFANCMLILFSLFPNKSNSRMHTFQEIFIGNKALVSMIDVPSLILIFLFLNQASCGLLLYSVLHMHIYSCATIYGYQ